MCRSRGIRDRWPGRANDKNTTLVKWVVTCGSFAQFFFFLSCTTLCEFWLAQLFLFICSSPASFVSNYSLPSSSSHSSHRPPILLLAFLSVLLHTVYGLGHSFIGRSFYMPQPAQSFVFYISQYIFVINCFFQFFICFESPLSVCLLCWAKYPSQYLPFEYQ